MNERPNFASIDDYIASVSAEARPIMEEIRGLVKITVPVAIVLVLIFQKRIISGLMAGAVRG